MEEQSSGTSRPKMYRSKTIPSVSGHLPQLPEKAITIAPVMRQPTSANGSEMDQQKVAQIYVQSGDNVNAFEQQDGRASEQAYDNVGQDFSLPDEMSESMDDIKTEPSDIESVSDFNYNSMCHYYRVQLARDTTRCNKVPSLLLETIGSLVSIANIIVAFIAFHHITYDTTGLPYNDYVKDDGAQYHGETIKPENVNYLTIHIYREAVFINWRNFVYVGLSLIILEILAPLLRVIIVTKKAPKKINSLHTIVQICLLTSLVLEDGAISLCKNMLFSEECGIRAAMMSTISQTSASISFVNTVIKTCLFIWRSSYRTQRAVRDEMEVYTEILILEEYQWYHCIIPILSHIAVIFMTIWSLINATNANLICVPKT